MDRSPHLGYRRCYPRFIPADDTRPKNYQSNGVTLLRTDGAPVREEPKIIGSSESEIVMYYPKVFLPAFATVLLSGTAFADSALNDNDLQKMHETYVANQTRFAHDYVGKTFAAPMRTSPKIFSIGETTSWC